MKRIVANEKNKGITLIALIVTIIVLIILAGVSISMLTGENGILSKASSAKKKTQVANEKEAVSMAALEALTIGNGTISKNTLKTSMKSYLGQDVELVGEGPWKYEGTDGVYVINESGTVKSGWMCNYDKNGAPESVTNGKVTLNIGAYINYDPGTEESYTSPTGTYQQVSYYVTGPDSNKITQLWGCANASDYQKMLDDGTVQKGNGNSNQTFVASNASNVKWKVLGADDETGELLIVAADVLKNTDNSTQKLVLRGITGYLNGVEELNKVCQVYGKGKGATGARSINYEDIGKVIGRKRGTNTASYTYTWTADSNTNHSPSYNGGKNYLGYWHTKADEQSVKDYNASNPKDKTLLKTTSTGVFNFYNTTTGKWETNTQELNELTETKTIGTVKPDYVGYSSVTAEQKATKGYDVVFKTDAGEEIVKDVNKDGVWQSGDDNRYWLGSSYCNADSNFAYWGMDYVYASGYVYGGNTYYSFGLVTTPSYGVRPVVSLDSDIQLELNSTQANTYDIK